MRLSMLCVAAIALVPAFALAAGIVVHVPGDAATIQAGIDAAQAADTVMVACGTYYEHDIVMKAGVCLMSETSDTSCVTIDAQGLGRCIYCDLVVGSASITGFTLTHGEADRGAGIYGVESDVPIRNCRFIDNGAVSDGGGGVYWFDGVVDIADCTFEDNTAQEGTWPSGGGLALQAIGGGSVERCEFRHNEASYGGGGIACWGEVGATIDSCTFVENGVPGSYGYGGGVFCEGGASPAFWNCTFEGNSAGYAGGGVYVEDDCSPSFSGCTFDGNQAQWGGGVYIEVCISIWLVDCSFHANSATDGGGFYAWDVTSLTFTNVDFSQNIAVEGGGGLTCDSGSAVSTSGCTFDRNSADWGAAVAAYSGSGVTMDYCTLAANDDTDGSREGGGAVYTWTASSVDLNNCIVAFNTAGEAIVCELDRSSYITCTDIYGNDGGDWTDCIASQAGGSGNLNVDPKFCGLLGADYSLCANSPCLPDHNDCAVRMGALDAGCGDCDSVVKATSWGAIKALYR